MKYYLTLSFFLLARQILYGYNDSLLSHTIYRVNRASVSTLIGVGSVADFLAIKPLRNKPEITDADFKNLNRDELNSFDRWALNQNPNDRKKFQHISDYGQVPFYLIPPVIFAISKTLRHDWLDISLMYWEGHTITFFSYNYGFLGPRFQNRYRPVVYYDSVAPENKNIGYDRSSFYSGHVASVSYTSFFVAKVYADYDPALRAKKYLLYAAALIPPLAMSYVRVKALDHFPSDCMAGILIGATIGIAVPEFHRIHRDDLSLGLFPVPGGSGLTLRWNFQRGHIPG